MKEWFVYMLRCSDQSLYTGITIDVERRVQEHNESPQGATYTRSRKLVTLVYQETHASRSAATKREMEIKKLSKQEKESLVMKGLITK